MKKYIVGAFALLTICFVSAFAITEKKAPAEKAVLTVWYFDGSSAQIKNATSYRKTGSAPADCQSTGTRPCAISVNAADQAALQDYLDPLSASTITGQSPQKRP